jgi:DNA (cytosine-5)-methyltransferase 1
VDEDVYPEFYRKSSEHVKGSNVETPEPFCVGHIKTIFTKTNNDLIASWDIWIRVNKFYRPENTHRGPSLSQQVDLNMLYWSEEGKYLQVHCAVCTQHAFCSVVHFLEIGNMNKINLRYNHMYKNLFDITVSA